MAGKIDHQRFLNSVDTPLVAVNTDCRITAFNRAAERLTGYRASELLDRPCTTLFPEERCEPVCRCQEAAAEGGGSRYRTILRRRDGTPIPISLTTAPLYDEFGRVVGALETIHTNSGSERITEMRDREASHNDAILDSLTEGVITIDQEWRITSFNAAAEKLLGYSAGSALGQVCNRLLRGDRCDDGCPLARTLERDEPVRDERVHLTRSDGRPVQVMLNAAVLNDGTGEALGGVLTFRESVEAQQLRESMVGGDTFMGIVARSSSMRNLCALIREVADSQSTVLITGESGTGKEVVANAIQKLSARRDEPFVKLNCAAIPETLLESELFGHVKGAFTDAKRDHRGRFELAHGGTLFLDEIGDLAPQLQVKLLRVLQDRRFERVGGEETVEVDVRLIAATNRPLEELVRAGRFREDLYYRLNVIPVHIPPLRDRREDIAVLVEHFVNRQRLVTGKPVDGISDDAMHVLAGYDWPGNVRELENAIEHAFVRARGRMLDEKALPAGLTAARAATGDARRESTGAQAILDALEHHHWHHGHAAKELGISRTTLWRRMKRHGIETEAPS